MDQEEIQRLGEIRCRICDLRLNCNEESLFDWHSIPNYKGTIVLCEECAKCLKEYFNQS